jgi:hypothetical protein
MARLALYRDKASSLVHAWATAKLHVLGLCDGTRRMTDSRTGRPCATLARLERTLKWLIKAGPAGGGHVPPGLLAHARLGERFFRAPGDEWAEGRLYSEMYGCPRPVLTRLLGDGIDFDWLEREERPNGSGSRTAYWRCVSEGAFRKDELWYVWMLEAAEKALAVRSVENGLEACGTLVSPRRKSYPRLSRNPTQWLIEKARERG